MIPTTKSSRKGVLLVFLYSHHNDIDMIMIFARLVYFFKIVLAVGDPCQPNPCENGGRCNPGHGEKLFECVCREGFTGAKCEGEMA